MKHITVKYFGKSFLKQKSDTFHMEAHQISVHMFHAILNLNLKKYQNRWGKISYRVNLVRKTFYI